MATTRPPALTTWPDVLSEAATIAAVRAGASLARFSKSEWELLQGRGYRLEPANAALTAELRQILRAPPPGLLLGIPPLTPAGPKYASWVARVPTFLPFLAPQPRYGSAFISRGDMAPWIDTYAYAMQVCALWDGRRVALVCHDRNPLVAALGVGAQKYVVIPCPAQQAYAQCAALEAAVGRAAPDVALLSCGPTATCLAARLTRQGLQAIDLGMIGRLLRRHLATPGPPRYWGTLSHPDAPTREALQARLTAAGYIVYSLAH